MCMNRILQKDSSKPLGQAQRRLNPLLMDMVKKEISKFIKVRYIYLISNSKWVSHIQIVKKKKNYYCEKSKQWGYAN